ncbi:MAG TPA: hypothetical protein VFW25_13330 [Silvibacterium sp.]|nr:hypothetical protein [Silvibacterium sp.]
MGAPFWIFRFLFVFAGAAPIIAGAQFLKGHTVRYSIGQGLIWGAITAAVYVAALLYQRRKGRQCATCPVPPEIPNFLSSTSHEQ